jgi:thiamine pyrophosphate-dependent acetolactate synthase large subunit-like protein
MEVYLRRMLEDRERSSEYVGMDFATPLPLAEIAQAMGVPSEKIEDPAALGPAIARGIASGKPSLVDVSIDGSL